MSRTVRYIFTIVLIIAAAMWIMAVYRTCNTNQTPEDTELTNNGTIDSSSEDDLNEEDIESLYVDDEEAGDEEEEDDSALGTDENSGDTSTDTGSMDSSTASDDSDKEEESTSVDEFDLTGNGGEFLVIAGAFVSESNAKKMQRRLSNKGHNSAVKVFLGSNYHSVVMGAYSTESAAREIAEEIGGEAYVHKKRYPKRRR